MNCVQFEDRLNDLLDERRDPAADSQLVEHARVCPACRAVQRSYDKLLAAVAALGCPTPSPGLVDRIQRSLEQAPQPAAPGAVGAGRSLAWFALAASILLLVALGIGRWPVGRPTPVVPGPVAVAPQPVQPTESPAPTSSPEPSAVAQAAQQTGAHLADVLLLIPGVTPPAAAPSAEGQTGSSGNWLNQMASGLAPLTRSTTEALDFLLEAVPEPSGSES